MEEIEHLVDLGALACVVGVGGERKAEGKYKQGDETLHGGTSA
jgi:hypothetical protein